MYQTVTWDQHWSCSYNLISDSGISFLDWKLFLSQWCWDTLKTTKRRTSGQHSLRVGYECCWGPLRRGNTVILSCFKYTELEKFFFLEMCNGAVGKQTTPLPSSFLLKSFKASYAFICVYLWAKVGFFFSFLFHGIQAKKQRNQVRREEIISPEVGNCSAFEFGTARPQFFFISLLFSSIARKWM